MICKNCGKPVAQKSVVIFEVTHYVTLHHPSDILYCAFVDEPINWGNMDVAELAEIGPRLPDGCFTLKGRSL